MKFSALPTGTRQTQLSPVSENSVTKSTLTVYQSGELTKIDTVRDYQHSFQHDC